MNRKWNEEKYPVHMRGDVKIRNKNIDDRKNLCDFCNGTGNELFSMYRKFSECEGKGFIEKK